MPTPRALRGPDLTRLRLIDEAVAQRDGPADALAARLVTEGRRHRPRRPPRQRGAPAPPPPPRLVTEGPRHRPRRHPRHDPRNRRSPTTADQLVALATQAFQC